ASRSKLARDVTGKGFGDHLVWQQHEDDVIAGRGRERDDLEAVHSRTLSVMVVAIADADFDARVAEVECCAASEIAVTEHGNRLPVQGARRYVLGSVQLHRSLSRSRHGGGGGGLSPPGPSGDSPRCRLASRS